MSYEALIKPHLTWDIQDASKVQTYMRCPRKYFYSYVLGWRSDRVSIHLIFGEAWHRGMEKIIQIGYNNDGVTAAMEVFEDYYRQYFPPSMDVDNRPKTPDNAYAGFMKYVRMYENEDQHYEALYTEVAGSVPVGMKIPTTCPHCMSKKIEKSPQITTCAECEEIIPNVREMHFRLDSIMKNLRTGKYFSLEHKTGSRLSEAWKVDWQSKMQISLYTHVLYCLYDAQEVLGTIINGAFFYKTKDPELIRIPVTKSADVMQAWMQTVNWWLQSIETDFEILLTKDNADNPIMHSFIQNSEACADYGMCPYYDFCWAWPNPVKNADRIPGGFKTDYWNPMDREKEASAVLKDGKLIKNENIKPHIREVKPVEKQKGLLFK